MREKKKPKLSEKTEESVEKDASFCDIAMKKLKNEKKLSTNIICDASLMRILQPDTIELANLVVKGMNVEDPGLFIQITDHEILHQALALPDSPVPQANNAIKSLQAFRTWLINGARNVRGDSQVPANSDLSLAFHQLTPPQGRAILRQWRHIEWLFHLRTNRRGPEAARIGEFANVVVMDGIGPGRATFTLEDDIFA
jgi:hypothetical protein